MRVGPYWDEWVVPKGNPTDVQEHSDDPPEDDDEPGLDRIEMREVPGESVVVEEDEFTYYDQWAADEVHIFDDGTEEVKRRYYYVIKREEHL